MSRDTSNGNTRRTPTSETELGGWVVRNGEVYHNLCMPALEVRCSTIKIRKYMLTFCSHCLESPPNEIEDALLLTLSKVIHLQMHHPLQGGGVTTEIRTGIHIVHVNIMYNQVTLQNLSNNASRMLALA